MVGDGGLLFLGFLDIGKVYIGSFLDDLDY